MSTSKRSGYSSKANEASLKTVQSLHDSPEKAQLGNKLASGSPRPPLVLEPIQNPPTIDTKPVHTVSKGKLDQAPATPPTQVEEEPVNHEERKE